LAPVLAPEVLDLDLLPGFDLAHGGHQFTLRTVLAEVALADAGDPVAGLEPGLVGRPAGRHGQDLHAAILGLVDGDAEHGAAPGRVLGPELPGKAFAELAAEFRDLASRLGQLLAGRLHLATQFGVAVIALRGPGASAT